MLFHYLLSNLPSRLKSDDREVALTELLSRLSIFLNRTGFFFSLFGFIISIFHRAATFPTFMVYSYPHFSYLTHQTSRYLRGIISSSRTQFLSTPRSKSHVFSLHAQGPTSSTLLAGLSEAPHQK